MRFFGSPPKTSGARIFAGKAGPAVDERVAPTTDQVGGGIPRMGDVRTRHLPQPFGKPDRAGRAALIPYELSHDTVSARPRVCWTPGCTVAGQPWPPARLSLVVLGR